MIQVKIAITTDAQHTIVNRHQLNDTDDLAKVLLSAISQLAEYVDSPRVDAMVEAAHRALAETPR